MISFICAVAMRWRFTYCGTVFNCLPPDDVPPLRCEAFQTFLQNHPAISSERFSASKTSNCFGTRQRQPLPLLQMIRAQSIVLRRDSTHHRDALCVGTDQTFHCSTSFAKSFLSWSENMPWLSKTTLLTHVIFCHNPVISTCGHVHMLKPHGTVLCRHWQLIFLTQPAQFCLIPAASSNSSGPLPISLGCGDASSRPVRPGIHGSASTFVTPTDAGGALCRRSSLYRQPNWFISYTRDLLCLWKHSFYASMHAFRSPRPTGLSFVKRPRNGVPHLPQPARQPHANRHLTPLTAPIWTWAPLHRHTNEDYGCWKLLPRGLRQSHPQNFSLTWLLTNRIFTMHWSHPFFVLPVLAQHRFLLPSYSTFVRSFLTWWFCILFFQRIHTCNDTMSSTDVTFRLLSQAFKSKPCNRI